MKCATHTHTHTHTHKMKNYSAIKWNLAIWDNMDGYRGYYDKWNKSKGEDEYRDLTCEV